MTFLNIFKRKKGGSGSSRDAGLSDEHLQLRRAIERCDTYRRAKEAGQKVSLAELVATLRRNNFSKGIIKKAIEESWGEAVPEKLL